MIRLNYPTPDFKVKKEKGQEYIFDAIRKSWLVLNEEEWVRQNFIQYLTHQIHYPAAFIALEKEIMLNDLKKRFDILVYNQAHKPLMMIECKAPQVVLNEGVLEQLLRYHITVPVPFLVLTNGPQTYAWRKEKGTVQALDLLPEWKEANEIIL